MSGYNLVLRFVETSKESMELRSITNTPTDQLNMQLAVVIMTFQQFPMLGAYLHMGRLFMKSHRLSEGFIIS